MFLMKLLRRYLGRGLMVASLCMGIGILLAGCGMLDDSSPNAGGTTPQAAPDGGPAKPTASELLGVGDKVVVTLILPGDSTTDQPTPHTENIHDDGTITLESVGSVQAAGKTPGDLQKDIYNLYVPRFYTANLNVTVTAPERVY
jgi:protein involved in polysaccharide export with SLBB domain